MSALKLLRNFQKQAEKAGKSGKNRQFADISGKSRKNKDILEFGPFTVSGRMIRYMPDLVLPKPKK